MHRGVRLAQCSPTSSHFEGGVFYMQHVSCVHTPPSTHLFAVRVHVSCTMSARIVLSRSSFAYSTQAREAAPSLTSASRDKSATAAAVALSCGETHSEHRACPPEEKGAGRVTAALLCWWLWCWWWLVGAHVNVSRVTRAVCIVLERQTWSNRCGCFFFLLSLELWDWCGRGKGPRWRHVGYETWSRARFRTMGKDGELHFLP